MKCLSWIKGGGKKRKGELMSIWNGERAKFTFIFHKKNIDKVVCGCSWVENLKCILRIIMPNVFAWRWSTTFPYSHKYWLRANLFTNALKFLCLFSSLYFSIFNVDTEGVKALPFVHQILKHEFIHRRDNKIIGSLEPKEMLTSWISLDLKQFKGYK